MYISQLNAQHIRKGKNVICLKSTSDDVFNEKEKNEKKQVFLIQKGVNEHNRHAVIESLVNRKISKLLVQFD